MNLAGRWGPVVLATTLGLLSVPLVAAWLVQPLPAWQQEIVDAPPLNWLDALLLSLVSAVTASIVGGSLAGTLVRSRPVAATLVAIGTAWPIGIGMTSITAATVGIGFRAGIFCFDTCSPEITNLDPLSGFAAYFTSVQGAVFFVVPPIVSILLLAVAMWLARRGRFVAGIVLTVGAYAVLHIWTIVTGGGGAFACLAIGVMAWAIVLHQRLNRVEIESPPGGPDIPLPAIADTGESRSNPT